ncbi:MAG TPA: FKBP-type peptidyl-prolyl cis-trans isomerase [Flavisolibacter sp.]|nr:FKBP-type peptidyl-prolyl cis-trans isomerase [Flavisolibacter sp.]
MKPVKIVLGVLASAALLSACNSVDFKKTRGGVPYKIFGSDKSDSIKADYIVKFHFIQKTKDTVLASTYSVNQPQYAAVQPVAGPAAYADLKGNVMEIFLRAHTGDSIYIVQTADSLLAQFADGPAPFKKGDEVVTTIRILDVYKNPEEARAAINKESIASAGQRDKDAMARFKSDTAAQAQLQRDNRIIEEYLRTNNIQTQKSPWGVYVQVLNPGQGPKPAPGKFVSVQYKGYTFDGKVFDSGVYPIQVGMGGSIKGFEDGVIQLSKGGRAKIFIPSVLAYGAAGNQGIKPNENLAFDIEVLDISDNQPMPSAQPADTSHAGHNHD